MLAVIRSCRHSRQFAVIGSLIFATLLCGALLLIRFAHAHNRQYAWLVWNLFLAWIPTVSALFVYNLRRRKTRVLTLLMPAGALLWLVFFPNAPYLLTDLIHLRPRPDAPF